MTDRRYDPNVTRSVQDPDVVAPQATVPRLDSRTRLLLEGPIVGTLLRLATPNVLVMFVQAAVGLIETYFVAKLGTDALAGVALVFPVLIDRKSTRLNSSHQIISYAVFCLKKKKQKK